MVNVDKDVLLAIPDESIVPFTLESLVSAICVSGTYLGDGQFRITICHMMIGGTRKIGSADTHAAEIVMKAGFPEKIFHRLLFLFGC